MSLGGWRCPNEQVWTGLEWSPPDVTSMEHWFLGLMSMEVPYHVTYPMMRLILPNTTPVGRMTDGQRKTLHTHRHTHIHTPAPGWLFVGLLVVITDLDTDTPDGRWVPESQQTKVFTVTTDSNLFHVDVVQIIRHSFHIYSVICPYFCWHCFSGNMNTDWKVEIYINIYSQAAWTLHSLHCFILLFHPPCKCTVPTECQW